MWTYYGSKGKLAQHYPTPKHDSIIEPFAGAAKYSLRYWEKEVTLVDKYDVVIKIWKCLLYKQTSGII
jgi:site-specific DNA-adenine methylase